MRHGGWSDAAAAFSALLRSRSKAAITDGLKIASCTRRCRTLWSKSVKASATWSRQNLVGAPSTSRSPSSVMGTRSLSQDPHAEPNVSSSSWRLAFQ